MVRPRGWRKQPARHAKAAREGWRNRVSRRRGRTIQVGGSNTRIDRKLPAKKPGFRHTKKGGYFEYRRNRSDVSRKTRL